MIAMQSKHASQRDCVSTPKIPLLSALFCRLGCEEQRRSWVRKTRLSQVSVFHKCSAPYAGDSRRTVLPGRCAVLRTVLPAVADQVAR